MLETRLPLARLQSQRIPFMYFFSSYSYISTMCRHSHLCHHQAALTTRTTFTRDMSRVVDLTRDIVTGVLSRDPRLAPFPVAARYKLACVSSVLCRGRTASACPRQSGALVSGAWV